MVVGGFTPPQLSLMVPTIPVGSDAEGIPLLAIAVPLEKLYAGLGSLFMFVCSHAASEPVSVAVVIAPLGSAGPMVSS